MTHLEESKTTNKFQESFNKICDMYGLKSYHVEQVTTMFESVGFAITSQRVKELLLGTKSITEDELCSFIGGLSKYDSQETQLTDNQIKEREILHEALEFYFEQYGEIRKQVMNMKEEFITNDKVELRQFDYSNDPIVTVYHNDYEQQCAIISIDNGTAKYVPLFNGLVFERSITKMHNDEVITIAQWLTHEQEVQKLEKLEGKGGNV